MQTVGGDLTRRPLTAADLPLLVEWLRERHVARWWNHQHTAEAVERDFGASVQGEEPGEDLVVSLDGHPVGLLQRSVISDYPEVPAVLVAVVAANTASRRALEKAGLQRIAERAMEPDNPVDDPHDYIYRVDRP